MRKKNKKLVLQNGQEFYGYGFGSSIDSIAELVFNTSMVGYQEILSDSSYYGQIVVMTYPLIGNYGVNDDDYENFKPKMSGFIVRDYQDVPSNFRFTKTFSEILEENEDYETEVDTLTRTKNSLEADLQAQSNAFQNRVREKDREVKRRLSQ